jgi:hypothetical protein
MTHISILYLEAGKNRPVSFMAYPGGVAPAFCVQ